MTQTLILCGKAGAGKDTVAGMIQDHYNQNDQPRAYAFGQAGPLKEFAELLFGFSRDQLYGPSERRNAPDSRPMAEVFNVARRRLSAIGPMWLQDVLGYYPKAWQMAEKMIALRVWLDGERAQAYRTGTLTPRRILQTLGTEYGRYYLGPDTWIIYADRKAKSYHNSIALAVITDGRFPNEPVAVLARGGAAWLIESASTIETSHASENSLDGFPRASYNHVIENPKDGNLDRLRGQVLEGLSKL